MLRRRAEKRPKAINSFKVSGRVQFDVFNVVQEGASATEQNVSSASIARAYLGVTGRSRPTGAIE